MSLIAARDMNETLLAFIASEEMDNAARYLQAGRQFADLCDGGLNWTWADARRDCFDMGRADQWQDYMDADAELMLRGLPRPEHLNSPEERKRIAARIREAARHPDANRRLREDFLDFVRQCAARRN